MATIYQNALVTLCATHANNSKVGRYSISAQYHKAAMIELVTAAGNYATLARQHILHPEYALSGDLDLRSSFPL